jgi:hypothetical protein
MFDLFAKIETDLNNLKTFNSNIAAKLETALTSHNNFVTDMEALTQQLQGTGLPVPMVVSTAIAQLANAQPMLAAFGPKIAGITAAMNQVLSDMAAPLAPAVAPVLTPAELVAAAPASALGPAAGVPVGASATPSSATAAVEAILMGASAVK